MPSQLSREPRISRPISYPHWGVVCPTGPGCGSLCCPLYSLIIKTQHARGRLEAVSLYKCNQRNGPSASGWGARRPVSPALGQKSGWWGRHCTGPGTGQHTNRALPRAHTDARTHRHGVTKGAVRKDRKEPRAGGSHWQPIPLLRGFFVGGKWVGGAWA